MANETTSDGGHDAYEERFVAFIDILGFGDWVSRAHSDPAMRRNIVEALRAARNVASPTGGESGLLLHFFSDSVIASAKPSAVGLWHLLLSVDSLAWNLLQQDVWIRGGVASGGMFVDADIAFGTGINKAYRLESMIAKYPRVVLNGDVLKKVADYAAQFDWASAYASSRIHRDADGVYFLNYLNEVSAANGMKSASSHGAENLVWITRGQGIRDDLQHRIDATVESPEIYAKAKWMAEYWNRVVVRDRQEGDLYLGRVKLAGEKPPPTPLPFRADMSG